MSTQVRSPGPTAARYRARCLMLIAAVAVAGSLVTGTNVHALSTDREQPIEIEADSAEADQDRRVTIYRGNATIVQGSLRISGDTIWIHLNEQNEFTKLISEGRPARMQQQPDGEAGVRTADALRLEYYADRDLIRMLGQAVYVQRGDRISAERIEYDSLRGKMFANSRSDGADGQSTSKGRVKIQIQPKKK